jgi:hypothetical protein
LRSDMGLSHRLLRIITRAFRRSPLAVSPAICTLLAGLAVLVFAFLPGQPYRLEQYDLPKDVVLGVFGVVSTAHLVFSQSAVREDRVGFTLAAFLGWGLMAAPLVSQNYVLAWRTMGLFAATASVFLLARRVGTVDASAKVLCGTMLIISLMCALVLLEAYGGIPFLSAPGRRPGATLGNRNLAARLACMALPLVWMRLIANHRIAARYVLLMVVSAMIVVIVLSRSRGALLVACGLAVLLPAATRWRAPDDTRNRWRTGATVWVVGLVFGYTAAVVLPNRLGWTASDFAASARRVAEYQTGTGRGRVIQAATTWRMIKDNPLWGVGPGKWSVVYPAYAPEDDPSVMLGAFYPAPQTPRSDVLPLLAEWGTVGIGFAIAFLAALAARTVRLLASQHDGARMNGVVVFGVSVAAAMLGLFDSILRVASTAVLLALLVGLALGQGEAEAGLVRAGYSRSPRRYAWRAVWAVYAVLSMAFAWSAAQDLGALRILNSSTSTNDLARAVKVAPNNVEARALLSYWLMAAGRCDLAMPHLNRAAQLQPLSLFFTTLQARCAHRPD